MAELEAVIRDPALESHVARAIAESDLRLRPCPYTVVDDLLPEPFYAALIEGLPPVELFADRPVNSQQLNVPLHLAPDYSRRIWRFMAETVVPHVLMPAVVAKFQAPLEEWIRTSFALADGDALNAMRLATSDGRILLRIQRLRHSAAPRSEVGLSHLHLLSRRAAATTNAGAPISTKWTRTPRPSAPRRTGSRTRRGARSAP